MNDEQIKEVMRRADEIADYAWKEGLSDGANSNAKQDRECRAESRTDLEAYLRTIGEPAGYSLPAGSMGEKKWAQLPKDCKPIGLVFQRIDAKTGAITEAGRVTWADWLAYPEADEPESVNAELLDALKSAKNGLEWYQDAHPESASECDNEAMQEIDAAIARAESSIETPAKVSPCAGHAVQQDADERPRDIVLKVAGKSFRCSCGCNVFQKLDPDNENEYTCNACHATYEAGGA